MYFLGKHENPSCLCKKLNVKVPICNLITWKAETGGSLRSLTTRLCLIKFPIDPSERPCLKTPQEVDNS